MSVRDPSDGTVSDFWEDRGHERIDPDEEVEVAFHDFEAARELLNRPRHDVTHDDDPEAA